MNSLSTRRYAKTLLFFFVAIFAVLSFDASSSVYAATVLTSDVSVAVSLSAGEEEFYSIQVPADATGLAVTLSGGTGDLDLYTRYNAQPSVDSFACRPYIGGNNETCTHAEPAVGTWYIMVRGYSAGTSTLTATYTTGESGAVTELSSGTSVSVSLSTGEESFYSIQVPADATGLAVTLSGGSGDLDLYTRYNAKPDLGSYDCRPYIGGNNESCTHDDPAVGTWYIMVRGYSDGSSTLTATYTTGSGSVTELSNGVPAQVSLSTGAEKLYSIQIPADATKLAVTLSGGTGDLDLYTMHGTSPDTGSYTCRPYIGGNNETCTHSDPSVGTWYIMVRGYSAGTSTVTATYTTGGAGAVTELSSGTSVSVSLSTGEESFYSIQVPADATGLAVTLSGGSGDLDLYTRYNAQPALDSYDCRPYIGGNTETCTHDDPTPGTWYIMVRGYSAGSSTLTATYENSSNSGTDSGELPAAKMVWSSWYWPMKDNLDPNLYDNNEAMYRYDVYAGNSSFDAQKWEHDQHGPPQNPAGWWGHCHAWAAVACWESQPAQSKTLDDVTFRVRDQKGLMIEAYYNSADGSAFELFQDDPSPGSFWRYLQNEIAGKAPIHGEAVGFVVELFFGDELWNHPIYAYEVEYTGSGTVSGKITISYATDFEPIAADSTELYSDTLTYYFKDVVLSGSTPVDSGTWILEDGSLPSAGASNYQYHRPDAIWRPYKADSWAKYNANPHLDNQKLTDILGQ